MNALADKLAVILTDPLAGARACTNPVAYVGFDLPLDLMLASQRVFCHLPWQTGRRTPQADLWLESSFPGWARSLLQDWYEGAFDMFDAVVFTRGEDASQRLYYYVCELQRRGMIGGPRPLIFDIATVPGAASRKHCATALRKLLAELDLDESVLAAGIERANAYRLVYARLDRERTVPGHVYENIARASLFTELLAELDAEIQPAAVMSRQLVFAGSSPPDDRFHKATESVGWNICSDLYQRALRRHGDPVSDFASDPISVLARQANINPNGLRAFTDRSAVLMSEIQRTGAQAAVLWFTEEDEALAWQVPQYHKALEGQGVPALVLTRQSWDDGIAATAAIQEFLRELHQ